MKKKILVTGGLGYIGSHCVISLLENDYEPIIIDNLSNSKIEALNRIELISHHRPKTYIEDVRDENKLEKIFSENDIFAVIHFAGLKAVGESVEKPLMYYDNNLVSTLSLLKVMKKHNVKNLIFSSSATVYGTPKHVPIVEDDPVGETTNPYGTTKAFIERILIDVQKADKDMNIALLRYFNPIGAHPSGLIGEDPKGIPNNLMPYISQVAIGKLKQLSVFGNDYDTRDGTCIRDYIHVVDLALGHVLTIKKLEQNPGLVIYNLGTGVGTSVLELVNAFKEANNVDIPYVIAPRRAGDVSQCFASSDKAFNEIGFKAKYNIYDACRDSWNWQKKNPNGLN